MDGLFALRKRGGGGGGGGVGGGGGGGRDKRGRVNRLVRKSALHRRYNLRGL